MVWLMTYYSHGLCVNRRDYGELSRLSAVEIAKIHDKRYVVGSNRATKQQYVKTSKSGVESRLKYEIYVLQN